MDNFNDKSNLKDDNLYNEINDKYKYSIQSLKTKSKNLNKKLINQYDIDMEIYDIDKKNYDEKEKIIEDE